MHYTRRIDNVKRATWRIFRTLGGKIKHVYFVKNISYGENIESFNYNTAQFAFKSDRVSYEKNKTGTKADFSTKRARETVYRLAEANRARHGDFKAIFFTLTSKDQIKDYRESNKKIKGFIRRLSLHVGYGVKYIIVPELHKTGAIHYHGIFFNLPFIEIKFFRYKLWKHGYVDLQIPKKIKSTSAYIAKYMTKSYHAETPLNTKLYFCSRGLFRPETTFTSEQPTGKLKIKDIAICPNYQKITYIDLCKRNSSLSKRSKVRQKKDTNTTS